MECRVKLNYRAFNMLKKFFNGICHYKAITRGFKTNTVKRGMDFLFSFFNL